MYLGLRPKNIRFLFTFEICDVIIYLHIDKRIKMLPETLNHTKEGYVVISLYQVIQKIFGNTEDDEVDINHLDKDYVINRVCNYAFKHNLYVFISDTLDFENGLERAKKYGFIGVICANVNKNGVICCNGFNHE